MENVKYFKIRKGFEVKCWTTYQKDGFCHYSEWNRIKARIKYYNRTWEEFTYQTALNALAEKLQKTGYKKEGKELERFLEKEKKTLIDQDLKGLKTLGAIAEVFLKAGNEKVAEGIVKGIARASGVEPPKKIKRSALREAIKILKG